MNFGQMVLVILATILFSTFIVGVFNSMMNQMEHSTVHLYQTQGLKLADQVFQEYESMILGQNMSFDDVYNTLSTGLTRAPFTQGGAEYNISIISRPSNSLGSVMAGGLANHQRIDVWIMIVANGREYHVGSPSNPFSKVLSRFELAHVNDDIECITWINFKSKLGVII